MSVTHTASPARSDVATPPASSPTTTPYRRHGLLMAAGAAAWAIGILAVGVDPVAETGPLLVFGVTSAAFQFGLLALLRVFRSSEALGTGRIARTVVRIETVLVSLAICSTIADAVALSDLSQPGWAMLDAAWPLSMLGMFLVGIRVAIAGRWKGVRRFWPLVAESWALVVIPAVGILGPDAGRWVGSAHLLVGYTVLGLLVARKER